VNPAFICRNWGDSGISVRLNGRRLVADSDYRVGHLTKLDATDLVVWVKHQAKGPVALQLAR
jgi:hypothetical protein